MHGSDRIRGIRRMSLVLLVCTLAVAAGTLAGCGYDPSRGDPVDKWHYQHTIFLRKDFTQVSIQTYVNTTQWVVGLERQDLYDGDRDGSLETAGMDRVEITKYRNVEDSPDKAVLESGQLSDYNDLFKKIVGAAKAGDTKYKIENREYRLEYVSQDAVIGNRIPVS